MTSGSVNAAWRNAIDNRRANLVLRALPIAVTNARPVRQGNEAKVARQVPETSRRPRRSAGKLPLAVSRKTEAVEAKGVEVQTVLAFSVQGWEPRSPIVAQEVPILRTSHPTA